MFGPIDEDAGLLFAQHFVTGDELKYGAFECGIPVRAPASIRNYHSPLKRAYDSLTCNRRPTTDLTRTINLNREFTESIHLDARDRA